MNSSLIYFIKIILTYEAISSSDSSETDISEQDEPRELRCNNCGSSFQLCQVEVLENLDEHGRGSWREIDVLCCEEPLCPNVIASFSALNLLADPSANIDMEPRFPNLVFIENDEAIDEVFEFLDESFSSNDTEETFLSYSSINTENNDSGAFSSTD